MDNNQNISAENQVPQTQGENPMAPPPLPPTTPQQPAGNPQNDASKSMNNYLIFIAVGIVLVIILALLYFFALSSEKTSQVPEATPIQPIQQPTTIPAPTVAEVSVGEIETVDVADPEGDLQDIEKELQNL